MTWMLATSHANQLACQHLSQLNSTKNSGGKTSPVSGSPPSAKAAPFHPSTPSPPPHPPLLQTTQAGPPPMNGILTSPPITTNGYYTSEVPTMPIYTGPFHPVFSTMPQQGFLPPPPMPQQTTGVPNMSTVMPPMVRTTLFSLLMKKIKNGTSSTTCKHTTLFQRLYKRTLEHRRMDV